MKYFVNVHNMSVNDDESLPYIVVKVQNGEAFYYGAWSNKDTAERVAKDLESAIVIERAEVVV